MSVFEVRWPIVDDQLSLRDLVGVARREARVIAVRAGVVPAGLWSWRVEGDDRPWLVGSVAGVRRGRHREHLLAVNAAAKARAAHAEHARLNPYAALTEERFGRKPVFS